MEPDVLTIYNLIARRTQCPEALAESLAALRREQKVPMETAIDWLCDADIVSENAFVRKFGDSPKPCVFCEAPGVARCEHQIARNSGDEPVCCDLWVCQSHGADERCKLHENRPAIKDYRTPGMIVAIRKQILEMVDRWRAEGRGLPAASPEGYIRLSHPGMPDWYVKADGGLRKGGWCKGFNQVPIPAQELPPLKDAGMVEGIQVFTRMAS